MLPALVGSYPVPDVSQYQVPSVGRHTIRSTMPSPSMSPVNGLSPTDATPHAREKPKPLLDISEKNVPVDGRHIARSVRPSPSKSARAAGRKTGFTFSSATAVVTELTELVKTARKN